MFSSLFTTFRTVEPPTIVSENTQEVKQNYMEFISPSLDFGIPTFQFLDSEDIFKTDPLVSHPEAPITFDTHNIPDIVSQPVQIPFIRTKYSYESSNPTESAQVLPAFKDNQSYAKTMYKHLYKALQDNGIDADVWAPILVTHTSIESGWGNQFSRQNNNFGGIKGKGSKKVKTQEWSPSRGYYTIEDTFKSYPSVQAFADDYVKKLKNRFKAFEGTPEEYLSRIRKHGYFTASLSDYQRMFNSRLSKVNQLLSS